METTKQNREKPGRLISKIRKAIGPRFNEIALPPKLVGAFALAYSIGRSVHFASQQISLPLIEKVLTGRGRPFDRQRWKQLGVAYEELFALLKKDSAAIESGLIPFSVLEPESALQHYPRILKILKDGFDISERRELKKTQDFTSLEDEYSLEAPEYARRNYHFQTGGYFHPHSAEIYEHQVEILFAGAAGAMRRLILPQLKKYYPGDGQGLKFLELAAGTGSLSRMIKLAYPKATLTVTDMSHPYLNLARKKLAAFDRTEFVRANAESVPFPDQSFDLVFSCFLFHEVPMSSREEILAEGLRLLKPGGFYGFVDSIQNGDQEKLSWALENFPRDFHEPFYKAYLQNPMEKSLKAAGFQEIERDQSFLSKSVLAQKSKVC